MTAMNIEEGRRLCATLADGIPQPVPSSWPSSTFLQRFLIATRHCLLSEGTLSR